MNGCGWLVFENFEFSEIEMGICSKVFGNRDFAGVERQLKEIWEEMTFTPNRSFVI